MHVLIHIYYSMPAISLASLPGKNTHPIHKTNETKHELQIHLFLPFSCKCVTEFSLVFNSYSYNPKIAEGADSQGKVQKIALFLTSEDVKTRKLLTQDLKDVA